MSQSFLSLSINDHSKEKSKWSNSAHRSSAMTDIEDFLRRWHFDISSYHAPRSQLMPDDPLEIENQSFTCVRSNRKGFYSPHCWASLQRSLFNFNGSTPWRRLKSLWTCRASRRKSFVSWPAAGCFEAELDSGLNCGATSRSLRGSNGEMFAGLIKGRNPSRSKSGTLCWFPRRFRMNFNEREKKRNHKTICYYWINSPWPHHHLPSRSFPYAFCHRFLSRFGSFCNEHGHCWQDAKTMNYVRYS